MESVCNWSFDPGLRDGSATPFLGIRYSGKQANFRLATAAFAGFWEGGGFALQEGLLALYVPSISR